MSAQMCAALDEALEDYETENQQSFFSKSKDVTCEPSNDEIDSMDIDKSTTVTFSENDGEEDDMASSSNDITTNNDTNIYSEEKLHKSLYNPATRVYAKDDATGLLYPAFIRKVMWGPKSSQVNLGFCSSLSEDGGILNDDNEMKVEEEEDDDEEEDEDKRRWGPKRNCYHYYVHYMGWAITWDRWVEETNLYEDSKSTEALSKLLHKEYNKVKPKKKGQKMSVPQINKWMQRMIELEAEHKKTFDTDDEEDVMLTSQELYTNGKDGETDETMHEHFRKSDEGKEADMSTDTEEKEAAEEKSSSPQPKKKLTNETLQKQAQLHKNGLKMKRKKSVSDQLTLPFNLKKVLVEEWEVITQCDMVHNLPSKVSVRVALDQYLESKLGPLRKKQQEEEEKKKDVDNNMQIDESNNKKDSQLGKEWIDMVEGIALFFDQALPIHLLFQQERGQYNYFRRQILAQRRNSAASAISTDGLGKATKTEDDNTSFRQQSTANLNNNANNSDSKTATAAADDKPASKPQPETDAIPERMSEIYGCEHLLRLFTRLPSIVAESSLSSSAESRRIFSKLGDLVRYLQKNQSVFQTSYRKPLPSEIPGKKKKRKAEAITTAKK